MIDPRDRMKALRKQEGLTPKAFGERVGERPTRIVDIERKKTRLDADLAQRIVEKFHIRWNWLMEGGEPMRDADLVTPPGLAQGADVRAEERARMKRVQSQLREALRTQAVILTRQQMEAIEDVAYIYDMDARGIKLLVDLLQQPAISGAEPSAFSTRKKEDRSNE